MFTHRFIENRDALISDAMNVGTMSEDSGASNIPVSVTKCDSYEPELVTKAVREAVDALGGIGQYVKKGDRVVLKLNLLLAYEPEKAVTTHPAIARAIVRLVEEVGGIPIIADSPGGPFGKRRMERVYKKCGIIDAVKGTSAILNYDTSSVMISNPDGKILKSIETVKTIAEADKIISVPKPKTHLYTTYTGAVKNMYGVIPGLVKATYHSKLPDVKDFSQLIVDIEQRFKPDLTIMDAVIGMEGVGPSAGDPKKVGAIVAGTNGSAIDFRVCQLIGIDPMSVPTIPIAIERGILPENPDPVINVIGTPLSEFPEIKFKSEMPRKNNFPRIINRLLRRRFIRKPVPQKGRCTLCGVCMRACPQKCITLGKGVAKINYNKCISCFCCHELCPERAIDIK